MDYYLGQPIEVVETEQGWVGIWHHQIVGRIEVQFFPTPEAALELMIDLIRQDLAACSLMKVLDEWYEDRHIDDWEHHSATDSLVQAILAVLSSKG
jgi:hypothetical protein